MPTTFVLTIHADYGCRDRGACCTAGWPIPIERENLETVGAAVANGHLRPPAGASALVTRPHDAPPDTPALLATVRGACVFYRGSGPHRCEIQRTLGHAALPLACRQFPRVSLQDPRGTSVTLSHYCPTAADLLAQNRPVEIVSNGSGFPPNAEYVGLDVRQALPPHLRPDMLMDWESWWQWERESLALIDRASSSEEALARLSEAIELVRTWRPSDGSLAARIDRAFTRAHVCAPQRTTTIGGRALVANMMTAIPEELRPAAVTRMGPTSHSAPQAGAQRRFLAAHAFANWTAHQGLGLRTWLRSIETADALLREGLTFSEADLSLRHLVEPEVLAQVFERVEKEHRG